MLQYRFSPPPQRNDEIYAMNFIFTNTHDCSLHSLEALCPAPRARGLEIPVPRAVDTSHHVLHLVAVRPLPTRARFAESVPYIVRWILLVGRAAAMHCLGSRGAHGADMTRQRRT